MKILKTLVVFALAMCAALVRADPPSQVGRLNFISGPVSFAPADAADDWALAALNRPITAGDRLWADNGGRAEMHVGSTAVRLTEMTSVDVLNIDDRNIQLRLAEGSIDVHLRYLDRDDTFEVDTPHGAVLLNEPGSYRISVDPSATETIVGVRSGQADVLTSDSRFTLQANEQARITGTQTPGYDIAAMPPMDEFDRWAAARDRREDRIAATRYVFREMTGYEDLDEYGAWRDMPEYGSVWVPTGVPAGWAPYRDGHWVWISPWGWTWVDSMPWGFAPFHYGRWLWLGSYWGWAPGPVAVRPVYAPALVAFVGGPNFSVSIGIGSAPAVAWVPLGWREPYIPWYRVSPAYVRNVNIAHVNNINVTNIYNISNQNTTVTHINYANRRAPSGVTVMRRDAFVSARPVEHVTVSSQTLTAAPVTSAAPVRMPERTSFAAFRPGSRPPAAATAREVVGTKAPPIPARDDRTRTTTGNGGPAAAASTAERPRLRVVNPERSSARAGRSTPETAAPQVPVPERPRDRVREDAPPPAQPRPQQEHRVPTPPPAAVSRPAPVAPPPAASAPRPQQQIERERPRDRVREDAPPPAQPRPQPERPVPTPPTAAVSRPVPVAPPPAASAPRPQQQTERQRARDRAREDAPSLAQPRPQQERRVQTPPPAAAARPAPPAPKVEPRSDKAQQSPGEKKSERGD